MQSRMFIILEKIGSCVNFSKFEGSEPLCCRQECSSRLFRIFNVTNGFIKTKYYNFRATIAMVRIANAPPKELSEKMRLHAADSGFLFYERRNCSFTPTCQLQLNVTL